jgi:small neutral amino acid transporter SnatA (MarC family)
MLGMQSYPMYISTISLILLCVLTLFSYKNLKRQYKLGRTTFYIYFLLLVILLIMAYFGKGLLNTEVDKRELGTGFILFIIGFPFIFLSNIGIKRDMNLIDSLNRLR